MEMKGFNQYKEQSINTMTQGELLLLLDDTLDRQYPISKNLAQLYEYFTYELGRVKIGRRKDLLEHVKSMIEELRDAFRQAQKSGDSRK